ncbi:UNVERIFIED_CONTAM: hypothetical protein K2H54_074948 [Gekko kuhli]
MVEQADDAPLLFWAEGPAVSVPEPVEPSGWKGSPWGSGGKREPGAAAALAGTGGRLQEPDTEQVEEDQIVAVFVVTFDPRTDTSTTGEDLVSVLVSEVGDKKVLPAMLIKVGCNPVGHSPGHVF